MTANEQQQKGPVETLIGFAKSRLKLDVMNNQILRESLQKCQDEEQRLAWVRYAIEYKRWNDMDPNRSDRNDPSLLREDIENNFDKLGDKVITVQQERVNVMKRLMPLEENIGSQGLQYVGSTPTEARAYFTAYSKCSSSNYNRWYDVLNGLINQPQSYIITSYGTWYLCYFDVYETYKDLYNRLITKPKLTIDLYQQLFQKVQTFHNDFWSHATNVISDVIEIRFTVYDVYMSENYDADYQKFVNDVNSNPILFVADPEQNENEGDISWGEGPDNYGRRPFYATKKDVSGRPECLQLAILDIQEDNGQFKMDRLIQRFNHHMTPLCTYNKNYFDAHSEQGTILAFQGLEQAIEGYKEKIKNRVNALKDLYGKDYAAFNMIEVSLQRQATSIASQQGQIAQKVFNEQVWNEKIRDFLIQKFGAQANITQEDFKEYDEKFKQMVEGIDDKNRALDEIINPQLNEIRKENEVHIERLNEVFSRLHIRKPAKRTCKFVQREVEEKV